MQKVKIFKEDTASNLPSICMVCGRNEAESLHPTNFVVIPPIARPLGLLFHLLSGPNGRYNIAVPLCNRCKAPYYAHPVMTGLAIVAAFFLFFLVRNSYGPEGQRTDLTLMLMAGFAGVIVGYILYYFGYGRSCRVLCVAMDKESLTMLIPNPYYKGAYGVVRHQEAERKKLETGGYAPPPPPEQVIIPEPEPEPELPPEPMGPPPLEGEELVHIPEGLSDVLLGIKEGELDKVQVAVKAGGNLKERAAHNMTALHLAAIQGAMDVMNFVVRSGIEVDETCDGGLTPLHMAVISGNHAAAGFLLSRRADPNQADDHGRTPLHFAAGCADLRLQGKPRVMMIRELLKKGADPSLKDKNGQTPPDLAPRANDERVVEAFNE